MINIGIIGCGWFAEKTQLPIISKMEDVDLYAVFDTDYKKLYKIQRKISSKE